LQQSIPSDALFGASRKEALVFITRAPEPLGELKELVLVDVVVGDAGGVEIIGGTVIMLRRGASAAGGDGLLSSASMAALSIRV
jgi:hypothetical protein